MYIQWCKCRRRILTTGQIRENEPCEICQKEEKERKEQENATIHK